jgi:hypothetical protein
MLCPKCKSNHTGRSHRRGLIERIVSVISYYPYSCRDCHLRFLSFSHAPDENPSTGHPRVEREIKATRDAMKAKRKRRELLLYGAAIVLFLSFLYYITRDRGGSAEGSAVLPPSPYSTHLAQIAS